MVHTERRGSVQAVIAIIIFLTAISAVGVFAFKKPILKFLYLGEPGEYKTPQLAPERSDTNPSPAHPAKESVLESISPKLQNREGTESPTVPPKDTPQKSAPPPEQTTDRGGIVILLVENGLEEKLKSELKTHQQDIFKEPSLSTMIKVVAPSDTVHTLKAYIKEIYQKEKLRGVLLVGNVPTGKFYLPDLDPGFTVEGLILEDSIYQDILDACEYSLQRDAFSYKNVDCQSGITIPPYWVARLTPNSSAKDSVTLLKDYFRRNHAYRSGEYAYKRKALLYTPLMLDYSATTRSQQVSQIRDLLTFLELYPQENYYFIDFEAQNSDQVYSSEIKKPREYEFVLFNGHGAPTFHQKNFTPQLMSGASSFLTDFRSCSVGRFTTMDYIAGEYLFSDGLVAIAASTPAFATSQPDTQFGYLLAVGEPVYEAIKPGGIGLGSNMLGDPTLKMRYAKRPSTYKPSDPIITVSPERLYFSSDKPEANLKIKNSGKSLLGFTIKAKYYMTRNQQFAGNFGYGVPGQFESRPNGAFYADPNEEGIINIPTQYYFPYDKAERGTYRGVLLVLSNDPIKPYLQIPFEVEKK